MPSKTNILRTLGLLFYIEVINSAFVRLHAHFARSFVCSFVRSFVRSIVCLDSLFREFRAEMLQDKQLIVMGNISRVFPN